MHGELFIEHREVGLHEKAGVEVVVEQLAEISMRLGDHRILQVGAEFGIEFFVGVVRRDVTKFEPLAEKVVYKPV